jgi:hypothetical protein
MAFLYVTIATACIYPCPEVLFPARAYATLMGHAYMMLTAYWIVELGDILRFRTP